MSGSRVPNSKINWGYVGWQVLVWSVCAWAFALLFALVAGRHGSFLHALQISTLVTAVAVVAAGALGIADGQMMRPVWYWMPRTPTNKTAKVGDTDLNGLTGMGIALVVAPQLLIVGFVVLGNVQ